MTKENIYYPDDNAFDRFYKRARYQANSFVAAQLGSKAADLLTTVPDFAYLICKLMLDPDVPSSRKLDLGLALLYVLSPLDLVPDSVPLLGKLDDAYAIAVSVAKLLRGTERDRSMNRFREKVSSFKSAGGSRLRSERERLYGKVRQLEQEIGLLENNIGFFAKSKNAESLIADVKAKIERAREDMAAAIEKVKLIDRQAQEENHENNENK